MVKIVVWGVVSLGDRATILPTSLTMYSGEQEKNVGIIPVMVEMQVCHSVLFLVTSLKNQARRLL